MKNSNIAIQYKYYSMYMSLECQASHDYEYYTEKQSVCIFHMVSPAGGIKLNVLLCEVI